jgi:RNA 2',3'-cyclic 3'-phosphodiesterase
MARTRTFLGVKIGDSTRRAAEELQDELAQSGAQVKWVDAGNLHLTLLFLGELDDRDLMTVFKVAKKVAAKAGPFGVEVAGLGAFPTPRRPKVVWAGITDGAEELRELHAALEAPLIEAGAYRKEERAYTPHLTLGRPNGEADGQLLAAELPKYADWKGGTFLVDELIVYGSEMQRHGPEYTVLGRVPLGRTGLLARIFHGCCGL